MNEETMNTAIPEDTTPETDSTSAMEDDWDDIDLSDLQDDDLSGEDREEDSDNDQNETPEADQQTEERADEEPEEKPVEADEDTAQQSAEPEQTFDLKFLGETKTVSKDEVVTLAQKGLNHD